MFGVLATACVALLPLPDAWADPFAAPSVINPRLRFEAPVLRSGIVRFLTSDDAPPFNFEGPDGALAGYNIDLSRALCLELKVACTIQARRASLLDDALKSGAGDALIPAPSRADPLLAYSIPYLPLPARFAGRRSDSLPVDASVASLSGRKIGVIAGSAQELFLAKFFPGVQAETFTSRGALFEAVARGSPDLVFADGAELSVWLNSVAAGGCCAFVPGAFLDAKLLGPGMMIAVRAADDDLRRALDSALAKLDARGTLSELYLRYFPIPLF